MSMTELKETLRGGQTIVTNLLFPPSCVSCHAAVDAPHSLCNSCFEQVVFIADPMCHVCGTPFAHEMGGNKGEQTLCASCMQHAPVYDKARSALNYDASSRKFVTRIKYADRTDMVPFAARLMAQAGHELWEEAELIIPVPLHWRRLVTRRYNQAFLLGKELSKLTEVPLLPDGLKRTKHTPPQTSLDWKHRQKNVKNAFGLNDKHADAIAGKVVILVDDVMTTGATLRACVKLLKKAKTSRVYVLTLARRAMTGD